MSAYDCHVFVCCNQRPPGHPRGCCDPQGSRKLLAALKAELVRCGGATRVRINLAGCLDQCEYGPTLVIYPQGVWYGRVEPGDVPRIVQQTILQGEVIPELAVPTECLHSRGKVCWSFRRQQEP